MSADQAAKQFLDACDRVRALPANASYALKDAVLSEHFVEATEERTSRSAKSAVLAFVTYLNEHWQQRK